MKRENLVVTVECLFMVAFVIFAIWFFKDGYAAMNNTEESVVEVVEIPIVDDREFTNFVTDFYTQCESSEQFGVTYKHYINFSDYSMLMSDVTNQVDNCKNKGHVVVMQPTFNLELWYDNNEDVRYVTMDSSESCDSVNWVKLDYNHCDGNISEFIKQQTDIKSSVQTIEKLLTFIYETGDYTCHDISTGKKITYSGTDNIPDFFTASLGNSTAISSWKVSCTMTDTLPLTTKVRLDVYYEENMHNIIGDTYEYDLVLTDEYYLDTPEIVKTKTSSIDDLEDLYTLVMN